MIIQDGSCRDLIFIRRRRYSYNRMLVVRLVWSHAFHFSMSLLSIRLTTAIVIITFTFALLFLYHRGSISLRLRFLSLTTTWLFLRAIFFLSLKSFGVLRVRGQHIVLRSQSPCQSESPYESPAPIANTENRYGSQDYANDYWDGNNVLNCQVSHIRVCLLCTIIFIWSVWRHFYFTINQFFIYHLFFYSKV